VSDTNRKPASGKPTSGKPASGKPAPQVPSGTGRRRGGSTGPSGTARQGRRESDRRRPPLTRMERLRTPILATIVIVVVVGVGLFVAMSAAAPAYACGSIDTVQPAASGELGQTQSDMGNQHVQTGDKITYPVCPPASGKHINQQGYGPLQPKVYGPDDNSLPNGWVHNLEHGGLALLYSCDKGACDAASTQQLQAFSAGFPASAICQLPPKSVGPVVARFEQMPTKYAALIWDRVLYLDTLDAQKVYDFYTRYAERLADDGTWISPPEPQCTAPSAAPSAAPSGAPSAAPVPNASPSGAPSASPLPSASPVPSPSPS
jgi:Protein of unknown function (DUF3105)